MKLLRIFEKTNNISIRNKLLLTYVLVVILPVLLVGLMLTSMIRDMTLNQAMNEASNNVDRIHTRLNETFRIIEDVAIRTQLDSNLEDILLKQYTSSLDFFNSYTQYNEFNRYSNYYKEIGDMKLYCYNQTILDSGQFMKVTNPISNIPWFKKAMECKGKIYWQYIHDDTKESYDLNLSSLIKGISSGKELGVLMISVNTNYLNSLLDNEPYESFIINDTNYIIAANDRNMVGNQVGTSSIADISKLSTKGNNIIYKGAVSKPIIKTIRLGELNNTFKIVSLVPATSIDEKTVYVFKIGFMITAISLLFALILILIFSNLISKRVKVLSRDMHQVATGNFDFMPLIKGDDEIGQLSKDLGIMVKSIKELVYEVYEVNLQKNQMTMCQKEIELKMLANQINPHFLFNVLETIRMKAHCNKEYEIAEVVKLLGKIMRRNLEIGSDLVTLESEIELVESYLRIQKFRYGERINYEIHYGDHLKEFKILPLMIQPIVENGVIHGLESQQGIGLIKINIEEDNKRLSIKIEDNGAGMSKDRLETVLGGLNQNDSAGKSIGLKNIHQRIKLFYGEKYSLEMDSKEGCGTSVVIFIPIEG